MTTSQKIIVFLARIGNLIYLRGGGLLIKSSIHRIIADRQWKDVVLPKYKTLKEAADKMAHFVWKADGMDELMDAVCTPQKVQAVGFDGSSPHGNDCDEEAIWLTNTLDVPEVLSADFFTVTWYEPDTKKFSGHNVCLLHFADGWAYMDYNMPSKLCDSPDEVARLIISNYAGWDTTGHGTQKAELIVWCRSDKNLVPFQARMG